MLRPGTCREGEETSAVLGGSAGAPSLERCHHRQEWPLDEDVLWECLDRAQEGSRSGVERTVVPNQQVCDERVVTRRGSMLGGLQDQPSLLQPDARPPVQFGGGARLGDVELEREQLREQRVVAKPAALPVERHKEEVPALDLREHGGGVPAPQDG